jgi:branched-chain amino acid transport system permease protein
MDFLEIVRVGLSNAVGPTAIMLILAAIGLNIHFGYTGLLNFGQAGFMAVAGYGLAVSVTTLGLPFAVGVVVSLVMPVVLALLLGIPTLRLRADYLAIATIAFSEVIRITVQNARSLTGGNQTILNLELEHGRAFNSTWRDVATWMRDNLFDPIGLGGREFIDLPLLIVVWATVLICAVVLTRLVGSPWGRVLRAVREDEDAARALGKNTLAYKLQSLAIAAALGRSQVQAAIWIRAGAYGKATMQLVDRSGEPVWVTKGYTVENYVPPDLLAAAVAEVNPRSRSKWKGDSYKNPLHSKQISNRESEVDKSAIWT